MQNVTTKSVTQTADRIVTREVRGEEKDLVRVPISSTRQDRDGDRFSEEALSGMRDQIRREQPLLFLNHGFTGFEKPLYDARDTIGTHVDAEIQDVKDGSDKQLVADILPDLTHPEGDRMLEQVKQGQAVKFSVGFRVKDSEPLNPEAENDERQRFIDVDLMEDSKVGIPSNPDATASVAAKAAGLTEQLTAAGMDIDDEAAFAKALAAELVSRDEAPDPTELDGVRQKDATPGDTRAACDSDADCPDGEVCVDGECVDEDSVTQSDDFIMDDEAEERFEQLEAQVTSLADSVESLTETIDETLAAEAGAPDGTDDTPEETNGLTDEEREQYEALREKVEDADPDESETKNPDPDDVVDDGDGADADTDEKDHQTPEEVLYGDA